MPFLSNIVAYLRSTCNMNYVNMKLHNIKIQLVYIKIQHNSNQYYYIYQEFAFIHWNKTIIKWHIWRSNGDWATFINFEFKWIKTLLFMMVFFLYCHKNICHTFLFCCCWLCFSMERIILFFLFWLNPL